MYNRPIRWHFIMWNYVHTVCQWVCGVVCFFFNSLKWMLLFAVIAVSVSGCHDNSIHNNMLHIGKSPVSCITKHLSIFEELCSFCLIINLLPPPFSTRQNIYSSAMAGGVATPPMLIVFHDKYTTLDPLWHVRHLGKIITAVHMQFHFSFIQ